MALTIKKIRQKTGLTQKKFAPLMGMSQQAISRLESNYKGRKETSIHIACLKMVCFLYDNNLLDVFLSNQETSKN